MYPYSIGTERIIWGKSVYHEVGLRRGTGPGLTLLGGVACYACLSLSEYRLVPDPTEGGGRVEPSRT